MTFAFFFSIFNVKLKGMKRKLISNGRKKLIVIREKEGKFL